MKKILFIDDIDEINTLQKNETKRIIDETNETIEIITKHFSVNSNHFDDTGIIINEETRKALVDILDEISKDIDIEDSKVELVIDLELNLEHDPTLGIKIARFFAENDKSKKFFNKGTLLITLTSMYISADIEELSKNILNDEQFSRILYVHRPIIQGDDKYIFDKEKYAFPEFYMQFRGVNKKIEDLLLKKTYYGNFFGLIFARLFNKGANI